MPWARSRSTIIRRYLFGNVVQSVPVIATLNAADAILTLAGLGFLGLGIEPNEAAEWGYDLQRAVADAGAGIWWTALFPGLGDRAGGDRADARRRGPQRRAQPDAAAAPDRQADGPPARDRLLVDRPGLGARRRNRTRAIDQAGSVAPRPAHLVRHRARRRARRRRRQPGPDAGRDRRPGRRVRLRQVDARARRDRAAAGDRRPLRRGPLRGPQHPRPQAEGPARAARAGPRDDLPGADDPAQPADEDLAALRGGAADARAGHRQEGGAQAGARGAARHGHPADALRAVPARVLGRHAAADHDRAGARAAAGGGRRRRADDGARRARRGPDPAHPGRPAAQLRHVAAADHAQPRDRRRGVRPRRGHVRGPDRRAGPGLRRHDQAVASVFARAAALDDLALHRQAALDPGRAAGPREPAAGVPVPSRAARTR